MRRLIVLAILLIFLIHDVAAIQTDTITISMEPDSRECFEVRLPDDMGAVLPGRMEYHVTVVPESAESWLDLTELSVRTDENEAVGIPVCFSSVGRPVGNCSEPFTLTIKAIGLQIMPDKIITGRACVSTTKDVDTSTSGTAPGVDAFDMALEDALIYTKPGEPANYTVMLQSQMSATVDVEVTSGGKSIVNKTAQFGRTNYTTVTFTLKAAQTGEYKFNVAGKVRGCGSGLCSKSVSGTLVVTDTPVEETGFTVSLFPRSIDAKAMEPVEFKATIENNMQSSGSFSLTVKLPSGADSDFSQKALTIPAGGRETVPFNVTPQKASSQMAITVNATNSLGRSKTATSYLSTDEMLTEVERLAEKVGTEASSTVVDDYLERYASGETDITDFEDAAITLDEMEPEEVYDDVPADEPVETPVLAYGIIAAAVVAAALVAYKFLGKKGSGLDQEFSLK